MTRAARGRLICPSVDQAVIRGDHQILAPALLRSQVLSLLYQAVRRGEMTRKDAERQLEYVRGLRIRLYIINAAAIVNSASLFVLGARRSPNPRG